ncbi:hypothetical protein B0H19DRAFT_1226632 [Mycena capillaripes]|nr:hypothetical protein B0H19DRAFT_1226632 [Mycena capillaripes]
MQHGVLLRVHRSPPCLAKEKRENVTQPSLSNLDRNYPPFCVASYTRLFRPPTGENISKTGVFCDIPSPLIKVLLDRHTATPDAVIVLAHTAHPQPTKLGKALYNVPVEKGNALKEFDKLYNPCRTLKGWQLKLLVLRPKPQRVTRHLNHPSPIVTPTMTPPQTGSTSAQSEADALEATRKNLELLSEYVPNLGVITGCVQALIEFRASRRDDSSTRGVSEIRQAELKCRAYEGSGTGCAFPRAVYIPWLARFLVHGLKLIACGADNYVGLKLSCMARPRQGESRNAIAYH